MPLRCMHPIFAALLAFALLLSCRGASDSERDVLFEQWSVVSAKLDRGEPVEPYEQQVLSILGREDLVLREGGASFRPAPCPGHDGALPALDEIEARAAQTSIVIINEAHDQSLHRDFIGQVARRLRPLGYTHYAAESLSNPPTRLDPRYPHERQGYYTREASFGRLLREVQGLGYQLVTYEQRADQRTNPPDLLDRIEEREQAQADNLMDAILGRRPDTKLLIHVGYSHALKAPQPIQGRLLRWLAIWLWEKTGVEPLTISQTTCRGSSNATTLAAPSAQPIAGGFDLIVDHRLVTFSRHRPRWRIERGDR